MERLLTSFKSLLKNKTLQILLVAVLYFVAARIGLLLAYKNTNASPVWPPSGLALALLVLWGSRVWPGVFIGAFIVNVVVFSAHSVAGMPVILADSFAIACGNTLEAVLGSYLLVKWIGPVPLMSKYKNVFLFALAAIPACLVSSVIGVTTLSISGIIPWESFGLVWRTWFMGDGSGMFVFAPLVLVWTQPLSGNRHPGRAVVELVVNFILLLILSDVIFSQLFFSKGDDLTLRVHAYTFLPFLLWLAFRQNNRAVITGLAMVSILAIVGTINMHGIFVGGTLNQSLVELQRFVSVIMISFMALSALLTEQRDAARALRMNQESLELRVSERTYELQKTNDQLSEEIVAHKKAEEALTTAEKDFRDACKIAKLGHWQWDIPSNVVTWSEELKKIFGIPPETFNASYEGYLDAIYPEDRAVAERVITEALKTGNPFDFYHRLIRPDGYLRWLHGSGRVIKDDAGNPVKMIGTAQDVTETKEKELLSSYLTAIITYSGDAIISRSLDGNITSWNKSAEHLFGYTSEEVLGKNVLILVPPDKLTEVKKVISKINEGDTVTNYEVPLINKDKETIDVSLTASPMIDGLGKILGASLIIRDITASKQQEDERFKMIVESAPNAMVLVNSEGKIEIANTQAEKLFGYSRSEMLGNSIEMLLPNRFRGKHPGHRSHFFAKPETRPMGAGRDLFGLHKDGHEIPVEIGLNPIETPEGTLVLAAIIDISERKKAEEAGRAKEIAEASVKMKDHFMANMSHEVRTPMNAIIGFSDLLEKTSLTSEQKQFVTAVKTSGQNLLTIINDILDISKIESGKMIIEKIPMNIADLLISLYEVMKLKAEEKGLELIFDYPKNKNFIVLGDPTRLTQVLMNLLGNAIKFTETGSVLMQMHVLRENQDSCTFAFRVKDTGIGIQSEKLKIIFDRFTQATSEITRKYGGTGLGLSIVKDLVELQHGTITVKSEEGKGSEFVMIIEYSKLRNPQDYIPQTELVVNESLPIGHLKVLVVEDNRMNQQLALTILRNFGFTTDVADNGEVGVQKVAANNYDLVLMDIQMPVKDGYSATQMIREQLRSNVPIIAMTAHAMLGEREKCMQLGMNEYISKPFKTDELLSKIKEVVNNEKITFRSLDKKTMQAIDHTEPSNNERVTNFTYLNDIAEGNKTFIIEMLQLFNEQVPEDMQILETAIQSGDYPTIKNTSHKLKSSASLVGMNRIAQVLATMQDLGAKQGNIEEIKTHFADVQANCNKAYSELNEYLKENA